MHESENSAVFEPALKEEGGSPESPELSDLGYVLWWSWLHPRRAAERAADWPLTKCFLFHFAVGFLGAMLISMWLGIFDSSARGFSDQAIDLAREFDRGPFDFVLTCCGIFVVVEGIHVALAWVLSAWGSLADERLRDSLRSAMRQTWLRTPHAVFVAFLLGTGINAMEIKIRAWRDSHPDVLSAVWPTAPTFPALSNIDPNYAAAMRQYQQANREYQAAMAKARHAWLERWQSQPWYVRLDQQIYIATVILGIGWWFAGLLLAVSARRFVPARERSPLCLWCGYDLSTLAMENRCPECGVAVEKSLGDGVQPGPAWERRQTDGAIGAWWRTFRRAVRQPETFGRELRVFEQRDDHRLFLVPNLAVIFLLGVGGFFTLGVTARGNAGFISDIPLIISIGLIFGIMCVVGATVVSCGVASLVGWVASIKIRRNLLPASAQLAAYCSPYLVAGAFFGAVLINCYIYLEMQGLFRAASELTGFSNDSLFFLGLLVPNALCGILYIALVVRGTRGACFANR